MFFPSARGRRAAAGASAVLWVLGLLLVHLVPDRLRDPSAVSIVGAGVYLLGAAVLLGERLAIDLLLRR